jgi:membrane protease YdiL (CAAX protease family)
MREPDAWDAVRVLAIFFLLYAAVGALGSMGIGVPPIALGAALQAIFLAVPLAYARPAGLRPFQASGFSRLGARRLALVLAASLGSLWLLKGLSDLDLRVLTGLGVEVEKESEQLIRHVGKVREKGGILTLLVLVAAPALCEEVFFRGLLFRGLARSLGAGWALAITTVLFASLHGPWVQKVMMVFAGLYFGVLVWSTGSLWAGVAAHAVNNVAVLLVMHLWGDRMGDLRAPAWMLGLSLGVFGLAMALLVMDRPGKSATGAQGSAPGGRPDR